MKNEISIANDIILQMKDNLSKTQLEALSEVLSNNLKDCVCINDHKRCDTMELTLNVVEKYIAFKKAYMISKKTLDNYRNHLIAFFSYCNVPLFEVNEDTVREYLTYKKESISTTSVNNIRRVLGCFFNWCFDFKYVIYNPCTKNLVPSLKQPVVVRHDITTKEMVEIKDAARNIKEPMKRYRAIALIDFVESTGCRVEEISKLELSDLYLEKGKALIHGKGNKERWVCLNPSCCKHIREYLELKKKFHKDSRFVFSNIRDCSLDKQMNLHLIEKITLDIGDEIGIQKLTIHIFRRYFATTCHRKGMTAENLRILMGHSNFQTTLGYINQDIDSAIYEFRNVC